MNSGDDRQNRLDQAFAAFLDLKANGNAPPVSEFVAEYPTIAVELRTLIEIESEIERLSSNGEHPEQFGDFELLEEIGHGGTGRVYAARRIDTSEVVALKVIDPQQFWDDDRHEVRQRFETEFKVAAELVHPHIVPVFASGESNGRYFISMKYIEGQDLSKRISHQPIVNHKAAKALLGIADALRYAHRRGIVHRDLKPQNILIDGKGVPYVTDFGLARILHDPTTRLTQSRAILGTPGYFSPEQARGLSKEAGPVTDVYGFGAVLYATLTGRAPFEGDSVEKIIHDVILVDPQPTRVHDPSIDRDLEVICLKCLAKDPKERFQSMDEVINRLNRYLAGRTIPERRFVALRRTAGSVRRRPLIAALTISLIAIALGIGTWYAFFRPVKPGPPATTQFQIQAPGFPAEEVEKQLAIPLERKLFELSGVDVSFSIQDGMCTVTIRSAQAPQADLQVRIESIVRDFEETFIRGAIFEIDVKKMNAPLPDQLPSVLLLLNRKPYHQESNLSWSQSLANDAAVNSMVEKIRSVKYTRHVSTSGIPKPQIQILLTKEDLQKYEISPSQLKNALARKVFAKLSSERRTGTMSIATLRDLVKSVSIVRGGSKTTIDGSMFRFVTRDVQGPKFDEVARTAVVVVYAELGQHRRLLTELRTKLSELNRSLPDGLFIERVMPIEPDNSSGRAVIGFDILEPIGGTSVKLRVFDKIAAHLDRVVRRRINTLQSIRIKSSLRAGRRIGLCLFEVSTDVKTSQSLFQAQTKIVNQLPPNIRDHVVPCRLSTQRGISTRKYQMSIVLTGPDRMHLRSLAKQLKESIDTEIRGSRCLDISSLRRLDLKLQKKLPSKESRGLVLTTMFDDLSSQSSPGLLVFTMAIGSSSVPVFLRVHDDHQQSVWKDVGLATGRMRAIPLSAIAKTEISYQDAALYRHNGKPSIRLIVVSDGSVSKTTIRKLFNRTRKTVGVSDEYEIE